MTAWDECQRSGMLQNILHWKNWNNLLDIGCGNGCLLDNIEKRYYRKKLYGLDKNHSKAIEAHRNNRKVYCGDACNMKIFKDNFFDIVTSTGVIEHVKSDKAMVEEAFRVLKPGGALFLATVFKERWAWHFYRAPCGWALDPTHVREYVYDGELLNIMHEAGFVVLSSSRLWTWRHIGPVWFPTFGYYCWEIVAVKGEK